MNMMSFKKRNTCGYSIIEIVITIAIIATSLTALMVLQANTLRTIVRIHARALRMPLLASFMTEHRFALTKEPKREIQKPATQMTYQTKKIDDKSSLKQFADIKVISATAKWQDFGKPKTETMITFVYKKSGEKQ